MRRFPNTAVAGAPSRMSLHRRGLLASAGWALLLACNDPNGPTSGSPPSPSESVSALVTAGDTEPLLAMPLSAGEVAFCMQGNEMPAAFSHSTEETLYALDLAVIGDRAVVVVAAAPGVVERVVRGANAGDSSPGHGFGNLVFVRHGGGWATLYGHLAQVDVNEGDPVQLGDRLGLLGDTGLAGYRHVHFSLHRSSSIDVMPGTSQPMHRLVAADVTAEPELHPRTIEGSAIICEKARYGPRGHFYASIVGHDASQAAGDEELARVTAEHLREQVALLTPGDGLDAILGNVGRIGPSPMKAILERATKRDATYWVGWYALGMVCDQLGDTDGAKRAWEVVVETTPTKDPWLQQWASLRLADLAIRRNDHAAARALLARAAGGASYRRAEFESMLTTDRKIVDEAGVAPAPKNESNRTSSTITTTWSHPPPKTTKTHETQCNRLP